MLLFKATIYTKFPIQLIQSLNMKSCVLCKIKYEKGSGITFHKFPADSRRQKWLKNLKIDNWSPKVNDLLCSKHFTDECFSKHATCTTLKCDSVPTLFLESTSSVRGGTMGSPMLCGATFTEKRKRNSINVDQNNVNLDELSMIEIKIEPRTVPEVDESIGHDNDMHGNMAVNTTSEIFEKVKHDHGYEDALRTTRKKVNHMKKALKMSRTHVKVLSQRVKRLKSVVTDLKKRKLCGKDCTNILNRFCNFKPELQKRISKSINKQNNSLDKCSPTLRALAIALNFYAPKAYTYVRKKFDLALPHPRVIRSWYSSTDANP